MKLFLLTVLLVVTQVAMMADGGTVQLREQAGDLVITVFSSPSPLIAGSADVSLLLQTRNGLDPVLNADVSLRFRDDASGEFEASASQVNARNKLMYAAPVMFPKPGKWQMDAIISRDGVRTEAVGELNVAPDPGTAQAYAGFIIFPMAMTILFMIREVLVRRRSRR